jgi:hypothetical protein
VRAALALLALLLAPGGAFSCSPFYDNGRSDDDDNGRSDDDDNGRSDDDGCDPRAPGGLCFFVDVDGDGIDDLEDDDWDGDEPVELDVTMATAEPALGPTDEILVDAYDDTSNLIEVNVTFAQTSSTVVEGGAGSLSFTGAQLGEGYGEVVVDAYDSAGNRTTGTIGDVLVDLTPPVAEVSSCLIAADGEFSAWIGDGWALGSVELRVGDGAAASETFHDWPASFRDAWDWSYFSVPASALPVGEGEATLVVTDRVGNVATYACALVVDVAPPIVALDAAIDAFGVITATITASDDVTEGALLALTLAARAVPLAESAGATTTFTLDGADFVSGPLPLEGRARDRAGNEGASTVAIVVVP